MLGTWLLLVGPVAKAQEPAPALSALPERFFQVQDKAGFFWQALDNGALISGETQYLQSGFNLIVDGEPFTPSLGAAREPGTGDRIDVRLEEKRTLLAISRDLWFDTDRSGVRVLDTFTNTGKSDRVIDVVLRTTYPFAWQSLHGTGGRVLGAEPGKDLRTEDQSLGVHFSPSEGRHDTFFLLGSEKGGQLPEVKTSANSRELVFHYSMPLAPGATRVLVHWILQRNLSDLGDDAAMLAPFIQRGQWIDPGVPASRFSEAANLPAAAFITEARTGTGLKSLVGLNEWSDRSGVYRRSEDLLALGPSSQVGGTLERKGELRVEAAFRGDVTFPVELLAAVAGGGSEGRVPRWFLRDGRVYVGPLRGGELRWKASAVAEGEAELLDPTRIEWLLAATAANDGGTPAKATHFAQIMDGSVLALALDGNAKVAWGTPWGRIELGLASITEMVRLSAEQADWRIRTREGACHGALPLQATWSGSTPDGVAVELPSSLIVRIWSASTVPVIGRIPEPEWIEFAEVPPTLVPGDGMLLRGNHILAGRLTARDVAVRDGNSVFTIDAARIEGFTRLLEPEKQGLFLIGLNGGEKIEVALVEPYLSLETSHGAFELPTEQILAYRSTPKP